MTITISLTFILLGIPYFNMHPNLNEMLPRDVRLYVFENASFQTTMVTTKKICRSRTRKKNDISQEENINNKLIFALHFLLIKGTAFSHVLHWKRPIVGWHINYLLSRKAHWLIFAFLLLRLFWLKRWHSQWVCQM